LGAATGMMRLWGQLHDAHCGPGVCVERLAWSDCPVSVAEHVRLLANWYPSEVLIFGYSWGAALGIKIARELQKRSINVAHLVLSDPVYRHAYWAGNWRAFFAGVPIRVPANVREVTWWRQFEDTPRGHDLVARGENTILHAARVATATHAFMDELPDFHAEAQRIAAL
jgi:pimeloyl-ACP methyl ester carboxylesterase